MDKQRVSLHRQFDSDSPTFDDADTIKRYKAYRKSSIIFATSCRCDQVGHVDDSTACVVSLFLSFLAVGGIRMNDKRSPLPIRP